MGIRFEPLGGGVDAAVSETAGFGVDAFLLARFAAPRPGERIADLGTGCGILPLLFLKDPSIPWVSGLELQEEAVALARLSLQRNGWEDRAEIVQGDWASPPLPRESYRLVVCNPPYFPPGSGRRSEAPQAELARHERPGTLRQVTAAAARLLQYGGRFCLCHRPQRLADVLEALRGAGLELKRLRPVQQREGEAPWLLLIEAKKGGNPGLAWEAAWRMEEPALQHMLYDMD